MLETSQSPPQRETISIPSAGEFRSGAGQVSVWVPIVVGIFGMIGVISGQLVNAWREQRRENIRWRREHEKEELQHRREDCLHWRDKRWMEGEFPYPARNFGRQWPARHRGQWLDHSIVSCNDRISGRRFERMFDCMLNPGHGLRDRLVLPDTYDLPAGVVQGVVDPPVSFNVPP